jgi:hypothetical protein
LRIAASTIRRPTPRLPPITTMFLPVNRGIVSTWSWVVTPTHLTCKTGVAAETHRSLTTFFAIRLHGVIYTKEICGALRRSALSDCVMLNAAAFEME